MEDFFVVPGKKSTFYAKKYLNAGNSKLKKQKYYEALENFNKSLCMADNGSADAAQAYASRSQVYFEIGEHEKCLENVQFAIDGGYPKSEILERENTCRNSLKLQKPSKEPNFFKLSHASNPKVPFVANCLQMMNHECFGRYIITTQTLKTGDIIAIEEPFFKIVDASASHLRCANCLKSNKMNLVPSDLSASSELKLLIALTVVMYL
jgi:SET and MYND domain-containing protein 4